MYHPPSSPPQGRGDKPPLPGGEAKVRVWFYYEPLVCNFILIFAITCLFLIKKQKKSIPIEMFTTLQKLIDNDQTLCYLQ
jgi:hypothetical protein